MQGWAKQRMAKAGLPVEFVGLSAERLPLPDHSFDTVVCTYTLCTARVRAHRARDPPSLRD